MLKRIISILAITLILLTTFVQGYSEEYPVFADDVTNSWTQVTTNEQLADAFRYYCKSRNLIIDSSVLGALTRFTTNTFNGLCNTLGIDITALQAQIKYTTDGNTGIKFLFSATGMDAFNRIFAEFLQNNDLSVGDEVEDTNLVTGEWFQDDDGNGCYVTAVNSTNTVVTDRSLVNFGTTYRFTGSYLYYTLTNEGTQAYQIITHYKQNTYTTNVTINNSYHDRVTIGGQLIWRKNYYDGNVIIYKTSVGDYYVGGYREGVNDGSNFACFGVTKLTQVQTENGNVYITTNNNTINNNTYNNNTYTIINNEGDVYNYEDDDEPSPDTPVVPDPSPDIPPPDLPSGDGWDDFTLPEMPNDWLIYGMEKKFPFDIPFNIMFALSLLNHEPVTPRFQGDIDLKVCTWHYDVNLEPFSDVAVILRRFEVLAFIIGLALITKELINWG